METPTHTASPVNLDRLVRQVVGSRRGKPGKFQREIAEALIPIVAKYRREFGTLRQVAGCASVAASESIKVAIYHSQSTLRQHQKDGNDREKHPLDPCHTTDLKDPKWNPVNKEQEEDQESAELYGDDAFAFGADF